tara:strand:- start:6 stop:557 length:552 start_codon:yes stop_codon:yes gene_type:complete
MLATITYYYHGEVACVGQDAWDHKKNLTDAFISFDLSTIEPNLRGFSEVIRVGRYAYFAPLGFTPFDFSSKMIRLDLGDTSVYQMYVDMKARNSVIKDQCEILDLSQANSNLVGFGGIVQHGRFLILSPFRNSYEPANGLSSHISHYFALVFIKCLSHLLHYLSLHPLPLFLVLTFKSYDCFR